MAAEPAVNAADRARVRQAIAEAEARTSGEIFAVVARECEDYRFVPILWAVLAAFIVPLPLIYLTHIPALVIWMIQIATFVVFAAVLSLPAVKPRVVPRHVKREAVRALAMQQFLAHGLHTTEARTGVLVFVALAERRAEIIADTGIAAKVDQSTWQGAMDGLIGEIGAGRVADGLVTAIGVIGETLARHFPKGMGDRNELPDDLVVL
jgi:putative membrane protein